VTQTNKGICWHWKLHFLSLFLSLILSDFNLRNMCSGNSSSIIFLLLEFVCLLLQTPTAIQSSNNAGVKRVVRQARNIMSVRHLLHTHTPYPDIIQIFLLYISKARSKNLNFRQRLNKEAVSAEETVKCAFIGSKYRDNCNHLALLNMLLYWKFESCDSWLRPKSNGRWKRKKSWWVYSSGYGSFTSPSFRKFKNPIRSSHLSFENSLFGPFHWKVEKNESHLSPSARLNWPTHVLNNATEH
jgi:hypothetical protein